jgi:hypothetical protein
MIDGLVSIDGASPLSTNLAVVARVIAISLHKPTGQTVHPGFSLLPGSDSPKESRKTMSQNELFSRISPAKLAEEVASDESSFDTASIKLWDRHTALPTTFDTREILFQFEKHLVTKKTGDMKYHVASKLTPIAEAMLSRKFSQSKSYPITITDIVLSCQAIN